ncbi:unnamed protein product [Lota lota]
MRLSVLVSLVNLKRRTDRVAGCSCVLRPRPLSGHVTTGRACACTRDGGGRAVWPRSSGRTGRARKTESPGPVVLAWGKSVLSVGRGRPEAPPRHHATLTALL